MKLTEGQYNLLAKIGRMASGLSGKPVHHLVRETEVGFSGYKTARGARPETIARLEDLGLIHVERDHGSDTRGGFTRHGTNTYAMLTDAGREYLAAHRAEKNPPDQLRVTYVDADGTRVPAVVSRLLAQHFDVSIPAYENAWRVRVAAQTVRFGYNGEVSGTHGRTSKRREHRRGPSRIRSLATGDIARVRVASGRSHG
jgi:hypothetical protein